MDVVILVNRIFHLKPIMSISISSVAQNSWMFNGTKGLKDQILDCYKKENVEMSFEACRTNRRDNLILI